VTFKMVHKLIIVPRCIRHCNLIILKMATYYVENMRLWYAFSLDEVARIGVGENRGETFMFWHDWAPSNV